MTCGFSSLGLLIMSMKTVISITFDRVLRNRFNFEPAKPPTSDSSGEAMDNGEL
jgi:hypothetical protein